MVRLNLKRRSTRKPMLLMAASASLPLGMEMSELSNARMRVLRKAHFLDYAFNVVDGRNEHLVADLERTVQTATSTTRKMFFTESCAANAKAKPPMDNPAKNAVRLMPTWPKAPTAAW